jgi:DNA invertase Pin-like site-specific DNA recombinase
VSAPSSLRESDPVLDALDGILAAARENIVSWVGVMERVEAIREQRRQGTPYAEMKIEGTTPPIIDTVARNQERLGIAAAALRRAVAHALNEEGMSHADIARAFGVSRQRVGMLLRNEPEPADSFGTPESEV